MQAGNGIQVPLRERLENLKRELFDYIEKNTEKVDSNIPVFYGYVISLLDAFGGEISPSDYDGFIDTITYRLLNTGQNRHDHAFIEKICFNAIRSRKDTGNVSGIYVAAGVSLMKAGDFTHAIHYLEPFADQDAVIGALAAYCHYMLSLQEIADRKAPSSGKPGGEELLARERMARIARVNPPVDRLPQLHQMDIQFISRAFWLMMSCALDWFPGEKRFLYIGLEKAKKDRNREMRNEFLKIAVERFFDDMAFLRESFVTRLEEQDAIGAAGVVRQMLQQHPDAMEPVYHGMKLAILTGKQGSFESFRKMALQKGFPSWIEGLLDLAFSVATRDQEMTNRWIRESRRRHPDLQYYLLLVDYVALDLSAIDEARRKRARKILLDSIDLLCYEAILKLDQGRKG